MTTIADVRASLKVAGETTGLRGSAYITDQVNFNCFQVGIPAYDPRFMFAGVKRVQPFTIVAYFQKSAEIAAQKTLDEYCDVTGAKSMVAAVQNGDNWDADVDYCQVVQIGATALTTIVEIEYLTVQWDLEVCW